MHLEFIHSFIQYITPHKEVSQLFFFNWKIIAAIHHFLLYAINFIS